MKDFFFYFKRLFSPAFKDKIKLLWLVLKYDLRIVHTVYPEQPLFTKKSDNDFIDTFQGLDAESLRVGKLFLERHRRLPEEYMITLCNRSIYCPRETQHLEKKIANELLAVTRKFHFSPLYGDVATLYYHNGLRTLSKKALEYIKDSVFIDGGAYCGDSAMMFLQYNPQKIISFEPSAANRDLYRNIMELNDIKNDRFLLCDMGLSSENSIVFFNDTASGSNSLLEKGNIEVKITTLDSFLEQNNFGRIGLIKADLEGMGKKMLEGAESTIRKHRPVLALSIYHNEEEFFGIYSTLQQWNLNYKFKILSLEPLAHGEITLIGLPMEIAD